MKMVESEQWFRSLVENNPDAIFSVDLQGNYMTCNPATERITGWSAEDLIGKSFQPFIAEQDLGHALSMFEQTLRGETQTFELTVFHKLGHQMHLSLKTVPIMVDNQIAGVYGIARDITDHKKTEELLRRSDRLTLVGQLAAGVAHEIRNPLTSIKGFVQLLRANQTDKPHYYDIILSELDRINFIVNEFMVLAKPHIVTFEQHDVTALLQNVLTLVHTQAIINNIEIMPIFSRDIPLIKCEPNQLKQVFINIMKNAIEAMPDGGRILIVLACSEPHHITIQFIDQGGGIPEERIPKLGEPFYTTKEKGTGLGLMICFKIIEAHRGHLSIQSDFGLGTTVDIKLPIA
ncbi:MAG: PAS domain-containing sensor histidine kinase [Tumebacillaceae bacterium]